MRASDNAPSVVGVVAIGRNEGDRLRRCLESAAASARAIVYVDSGSTDGSVELAHARHVEVVRLDMREPFTAARARNEGFRRLKAIAPDIDLVQFVDGDCEIVAGWMEKAATFLRQRPDVAVVCGRRRERYPGKSIYNMLCDIEWDSPVGEAKACGGDALVRAATFEAVSGYRADLIAGEEPELCVRLRGAGWRVWRLADEMTLHDAAMLRFRQWWMRTLRGGHAFAQGADLHGEPPERHFVSESRRAWLWGFIIPLAILVCVVCWGAWATLLFLIYPLQVVRLALQGERSARENWWRAASLVLGKFPEMIGQLKYVLNRRLGAQSRLIEYK